MGTKEDKLVAVGVRLAPDQIDRLKDVASHYSSDGRVRSRSAAVRKFVDEGLHLLDDATAKALQDLARRLALPFAEAQRRALRAGIEALRGAHAEKGNG
jgi:hypothetical protein